MQPPSQDPANPTGQPWQPSPYSQPEQPPMPKSEPFSSPQPMYPQQPPPDYHPVMPDGPWQPQQAYPPQQQMYQQPMQPPPNYNPAMPGNPWQPQQQMYQPAMQPPPNYNPAMPGNPWQPQQQMYQPAMQPAMQVAAVNVNMNTQQENNGCVRALYFVFIGWWLSFWCLQIGFFLCALIITLPLGLMILNRIPQIMTLKPSRKMVQTNVNVTSVAGAGGAVNVVNVNMSVTDVQQYPFVVRALYYIFVGCWVGYLWASLAYFLCLTILGLPLGLVMFNYLPVVLTLRKS